MIIENPSADGPFGAKAIGEMANNAQPPAIVYAIFDAVGVWVTEMPATAGARARGDPCEAGAAPGRASASIFDEHLSIRSVSVERRLGTSMSS